MQLQTTRNKLCNTKPCHVIENSICKVYSSYSSPHFLSLFLSVIRSCSVFAFMFINEWLAMKLPVPKTYFFTKTLQIGEVAFLPVAWCTAVFPKQEYAENSKCARMHITETVGKHVVLNALKQ